MKPVHLLFPILLACSFKADAQYAIQYRIEFKDKKSDFRPDRPEEFLSMRAIWRRNRQLIDIDSMDLPINPKYIREIAAVKSVKILARSHWFNDVIVEVSDTSVLAKMRLRPSIRQITALPSSKWKTGFRQRDKFEVETSGAPQSRDTGRYGDGYHQIHMLEGEYLHDIGHRGRGMLIGILDAGFTDARRSMFFTKVFSEGRVIDTYDFVRKDRDVYGHSMHGTYVLSTIAADVEGVMIGTAPEASFLLLRSEDVESETLIEEYYWVEAAEFADSAGADILNTSLGYTTFDDSLQNHEYPDMDGRTTRISRAAELAASRGILLFNSAGNAGGGSWEKINAPADARNIIAVGAVNPKREVAYFSSRGPSFDERIKPDLMAEGQEVVIGNIDGSTRTSNGTSFSSPVLTGMAACLWSANPDRSWKEIAYALIYSADRYNQPDTNYGYGIPNAIVADNFLKGITVEIKNEGLWLKSWPNPFYDKLYLTYLSINEASLQITFFDLRGKKVAFSEQLLVPGGMSYIPLSGNEIPQSPGFYIMIIDTGSKKYETKVVRK